MFEQQATLYLPNLETVTVRQLSTRPDIVRADIGGLRVLGRREDFVAFLDDLRAKVLDAALEQEAVAS